MGSQTRHWRGKMAWIGLLFLPIATVIFSTGCSYFAKYPILTFCRVGNLLFIPSKTVSEIAFVYVFREYVIDDSMMYKVRVFVAQYFCFEVFQESRIFWHFFDEK